MKLTTRFHFFLTVLLAVAVATAAVAQAPVVREVKPVQVEPALAASAKTRGPVISYSPLTGIGGGPSGPATAKIRTEPYCCPSTALLIQADQPVGENDFQWVQLGLTVPTSREFREIRAVEVCYELKTSQKGGTYISQTRLTDMTTPDVAHVKMDDGTNRTDPGPTCYVSRAGFLPDGTVTLGLKVVFASIQDEIRLGMVKLYF